MRKNYWYSFDVVWHDQLFMVKVISTDDKIFHSIWCHIGFPYQTFMKSKNYALPPVMAIYSNARPYILPNGKKMSGVTFLKAKSE